MKYSCFRRGECSLFSHFIMKYLKIIIFVFLFLLQVNAEEFTFETTQKIFAPTLELARLNGYHGENHTVTTEDGYVLEIHRLPGGRTTPLNCSLPPVLLMHGLLGTSSDWILTDSSQSLAFLLADKGYDVWLGNIRGNTYGRKNLYFDAQDDLFWNFSFHEVGFYDLPATIDYILSTTGHESILYVGHSMGTTELFVLSSSKPEYDAKVQHMVGLAPIAFLTNVVPFLQLLSHSTSNVYNFFELTGTGEFLSRGSVNTQMIEVTCVNEINKDFCSSVLSLLFGYDLIGFNKTLVPTIFGHNPAGTSIHNLAHFGQVIYSGQFQQYDYGKEINLKKYGSTMPPNYNLSRISIPMTFYYADNDKLADSRDLRKLVDSLNVNLDVFRVNLTSFNHLGFLWSKNVKLLVFDKILFLFESIQKLSFPPGCS